MPSTSSSLSSSDFFDMLNSNAVPTLRRDAATIQVNLGKLCNQACTHCHVDAGPTKKRENMDARTSDRVLQVVAASKTVRTVDLTGGAPEMNPAFRKMVSFCRERGIEVIDRCNLTVLFEPGQQETAAFLAHHKVHIVASLPCYTAGNVDKQRGDGVFVKSIEALKQLTALGYGKPGSGLIIDLVYNPLGADLPPAQKELEGDYRTRLGADFGIAFNRLFTITNMPIKRFAVDLRRQGKYDSYLELLRTNFNATAASEVMCRDMISIGWNGALYDCDFNQMLDIAYMGPTKTIWDLESFDVLSNTDVRFEDHCFGCTAGAGSSCKGALTV